MKINLSPIIQDVPLEIIKSNEVLTINGIEHDLSPLAEGYKLEQISQDIIEVIRVNGELEITIKFPISRASSDLAKFPIPLENIPDGLVELPQ